MLQRGVVDILISFLEVGPYHVLDAGSGTGRDTWAFLKEGFLVDAFDGSRELAKFSTQQTGVFTQVMRFEELKLPSNHYDGIWAMASLLHVQRQDMPQVLKDLGDALKVGGVLHATFKQGSEWNERMAEDGRRFTDMNEGFLSQALQSLEGLEYEGLSAHQAGANQSNQQLWVTFVLRKTKDMALRPTVAKPKR